MSPPTFYGLKKLRLLEQSTPVRHQLMESCAVDYFFERAPNERPKSESSLKSFSSFSGGAGSQQIIVTLWTACNSHARSRSCALKTPTAKKNYLCTRWPVNALTLFNIQFQRVMGYLKQRLTTQWFVKYSILSFTRVKWVAARINNLKLVTHISVRN